MVLRCLTHFLFSLFWGDDVRIDYYCTVQLAYKKPPTSLFYHFYSFARWVSLDLRSVVLSFGCLVSLSRTLKRLHLDPHALLPPDFCFFTKIHEHGLTSFIIVTKNKEFKSHLTMTNHEVSIITTPCSSDQVLILRALRLLRVIRALRMRLSTTPCGR